jgi:tetratricopeptide (TPR) repeat protein
MTGTGRTFADWIWTFIGIAGVACIALAIWMFIPKGGTDEDLGARVDEHYRAGDAHLEAGEVDEAIAELTAAAKLVGGRNPLIQNRLGEALREKGSTKEAVGRWFAALSLAPLFATPYRNLARSFEEGGDPVAAASCYRTARALSLNEVPEGLAGKLAAAEAKAKPVRLERYAAAQKDYLANPANVDALSAMLLYRLADVHPAADADATAGIRSAVAAVGAGIEDLPARIERQEGASRDRPESVVDRAGLALLLLLAGDERSAKVADEALEISATDAAARFAASLADLFGDAKDLGRMEESATRMGANPVMWLALGAAAIRQGNSDVAKGSLSNVLRLQPMLVNYPAIPEVYRLHALVLTDEEDVAKFRQAYERFFE